MDHLDLATVYLVSSALAFAAYGIDKAAAIGGTWRIPEAFLHLLGFAGGWPGALVAQRLFRHKSRKVSFQAAFWIVAAVNSAAPCGFSRFSRREAVAPETRRKVFILPKARIAAIVK